MVLGLKAKPSFSNWIKAFPKDLALTDRITLLSANETTSKFLSANRQPRI
jgi:hypothetical protein